MYSAASSSWPLEPRPGPSGVAVRVERVVCSGRSPCGLSLSLVVLRGGGWGVTCNGRLIPGAWRRRGVADEEVGPAFVELVRIASAAAPAGNPAGMRGRGDAAAP